MLKKHKLHFHIQQSIYSIYSVCKARRNTLRHINSIAFKCPPGFPRDPSKSLLVNDNGIFFYITLIEVFGRMSLVYRNQACLEEGDHWAHAIFLMTFTCYIQLSILRLPYHLDDIHMLHYDWAGLMNQNYMYRPVFEFEARDWSSKWNSHACIAGKLLVNEIPMHCC